MHISNLESIGKRFGDQRLLGSTINWMRRALFEILPCMHATAFTIIQAFLCAAKQLTRGILSRQMSQMTVARSILLSLQWGNKHINCVKMQAHFPGLKRDMLTQRRRASYLLISDSLGRRESVHSDRDQYKIS